MSETSYRVEGHIAFITLQRHPVNALSLDLLDEILASLASARDDSNVRAVIITSAIPDRFSAGLDLDILLGQSRELTV